jgi:ABC-type uncharacterized transport system ATPase subunit
MVAARGLSKIFGSFVANDSIDLQILPGRVHVLLGENGAGKSTFMNMLYGHLQPTAGEILIDGVVTQIDSPRTALAHGIGLVHQHFSLVPSATVATNVVLGVEPSTFAYSPRKVHDAVRETVDALGWDLDVEARVEDLPVSGQQRVEILKALHRGARTLLLDEPTALLSPSEIDALLETVARLRSGGAGVLLVTHKLKEVESIADDVSVLRHGRITGEFVAGEATSIELARAMTGRAEIPEVRTSGHVAHDASVVLRSESLIVDGPHARAVDDVSLSVREGEIVGIAAVEGNGQHELVQAIIGTTKPLSGSISIRGMQIDHATPRRTRAAGLAVIPADRREEGVVADMSLVDNFSLNAIAAGGMRRWGMLDRRAMRKAARAAVEDHDIRPGRIDAPAKSLSGGNMQKLVIARELSESPPLIIAVSPTWGLDIGAVTDVRQRLVDMRSQGAAILLSSPDLEEVIDLSDRILVMYRGRIVAEFSREALDEDQLALALIGDVPQ